MVSQSQLLPLLPDEGYREDDWLEMARIVSANWVYDMADDFAFALTVHEGDVRQRIIDQLDDIKAWLRGQLGGKSGSLVDRDFLMAQSRELLEALARRIRRSYYALRPLVFRHPCPARPDDVGSPGLMVAGQSDDPFGRAIDVNRAPVQVQRAFLREQEYATAALRIDEAIDDGDSITREMVQRYENAKSDVPAENYRLLAQLQFEGLCRLFGSTSFDAAQFSAGIWRMTVRGEWDAPTFSLPHWIRFIDGYVGVLCDGTVPNLIEEDVLKSAK